MLEKNSTYIMDNKNLTPHETINIPVSLFKSMQGKYFVGQTEALWVGNGCIWLVGKIKLLKRELLLNSSLIYHLGLNTIFLTT